MYPKLFVFVASLALAVCPCPTASSQEESGEVPLWQLGIATFGEKPTKTPSAELPTPDPSREASSVVPVDYTGYQNSIPLAPPEDPMDILALPEVAEAGEPSQLPIGNAIASGETGEGMPLEEQTAAWYEVPWRWITRGWENHAEFGLDGSSGNARTLALQTGFELKRTTDRYTLGIDFDYRKATTTGVTTEDNGRFDVNYDFLFQDSQWTAFSKFGSEWDQFKAFDSRINLNGGVGFDFVRTDDAFFITRFGAGASKEIGAPDDDWKPEAVFGAEGEYQLNRYNKFKAKVDYFPVWSDFSDYRVVTDAAWEILLDDSDNLSLKLAITDRYDSTPQGAKANDIYYSLLLLVKF
ncbi:MAG: DUF481 domain-containing protein [Planctomycetota bacterium]